MHTGYRVTECCNEKNVYGRMWRPLLSVTRTLRLTSMEVPVSYDFMLALHMRYSNHVLHARQAISQPAHQQSIQALRKGSLASYLAASLLVCGLALKTGKVEIALARCLAQRHGNNQLAGIGPSTVWMGKLRRPTCSIVQNAI